ncbi:MAG TPA: flagellar hook-associated protein 3, partial [Methylobacter sp.]
EYAYQGGLQQRALQISTTRQVADGDLGFNVFEHINSSSPAADENGKRSVFNTLKALSDGLGASLNATAGVITGDRFLRYGLDYSAATIQFDLVANGGITAPIDLSGQQFAGVEDVVTEINSQLTAGGFSGAIQARSNGNKIEFASVATGATSGIQINNTSGTFLTDAGFAAGQVKAGAGAQTLQAQLGDVLADLDAALGSFLDARSSVGARLNALDNQESQNEKYVIDTKTTLSETQDLDYAEAISKYQLQTTALQAAQQTFTKIKELSLFNYL